MDDTEEQRLTEIEQSQASLAKRLGELADRLAAQTIDIEPEIAAIVNEHFWEMYEAL